MENIKDKMVWFTPKSEVNAMTIKIMVAADGIDRGTYFEEEGRPCEIESCKGTVMKVTWSDGQVTYPCTEGTEINSDGDRQIIVVS
jgi:hypothetical protein